MCVRLPILQFVYMSSAVPLWRSPKRRAGPDSPNFSSFRCNIPSSYPLTHLPIDLVRRTSYHGVGVSSSRQDILLFQSFPFQKLSFATPTRPSFPSFLPSVPRRPLSVISPPSASCRCFPPALGSQRGRNDRGGRLTAGGSEAPWS